MTISNLNLSLQSGYSNKVYVAFEVILCFWLKQNIYLVGTSISKCWYYIKYYIQIASLEHESFRFNIIWEYYYKTMLPKRVLNLALYIITDLCSLLKCYLQLGSCKIDLRCRLLLITPLLSQDPISDRCDV